MRMASLNQEKESLYILHQIIEVITITKGSEERRLRREQAFMIERAGYLYM